MNSLGTDFEQSFLRHKKSEKEEGRHNLFKMGPTWVAAATIYRSLRSLFRAYGTRRQLFEMVGVTTRCRRKNRMIPTKKLLRKCNSYRILLGHYKCHIEEPFQLENWPKIVLDSNAWLLFIGFLASVNAFCLSRKAIICSSHCRMPITSTVKVAKKLDK